MTYDEWIATPEGTMALTLAAHCDTFKDANSALRVAFTAGRIEALQNCNDRLERVLPPRPFNSREK